MNEIAKAFEDVSRNDNLADEYEQELYEAFLTGWEQREEWNLPNAPHRLFSNDEIPNHVISDYYEWGWKRGIDHM